jgi:hypothetical protein
MSRPGFSAMRRLAASPDFSNSNPIKALLAAGLALLLVACGGGGGQGTFGVIDPSGIPIPPTPPPAPETLYKIGSGAGSGFQEGVINASHTTLRAGDTAQLRVNVVDGDGAPLGTGISVVFSSPCIATGLATLTAPTEVTSGLYSTIYTNNGCAGTDTVSARIPNNKSATVVLNVSAAQALTISHVSTTNEQLVLGGLGGVETSEVVFRLAGPQGVPIVGKTISFSISSSAGEARVLTGWESGLTDQAGNVRTIIKSGTVAGPITVIAKDNETGVQGHSDDITISTGVAVANRFSMSYGPWNPADAFNKDGVEVNISIIATDMFGNAPMDGSRVSFVSPYSGIVTNFCELNEGGCSVTWRSQGPRGNYQAVVLAYMDGAEEFTDLNGNSVFDAGDNNLFVDLPEPFADRNHNGIHDPGEFFFDANKNGVWDNGNGVWDGPCLTALNPVALCPGNKSIAIFDQVTIVMSTNTVRIISSGNFPAITPAAPAIGNQIHIQQGTLLSYTNMILGDNNNNALPIGTTVVFTIEGSGVTLQGLTSTTIGNSVSPNDYIFGVTLAATAVEAAQPADATLCVPPAPTPYPADCTPDLPKNIRLLLTVTPPGGIAQTYAWPVNVYM